jgi:hypothetical protein
MRTTATVPLPLMSNLTTCLATLGKVAGDKGISKTKSKQQSACSNCMHQPVTSWGNPCSTCMHKPVKCMHWTVMSQADACSYCTGSVVLILSQIYLGSFKLCFHWQCFKAKNASNSDMRQSLLYLPWPPWAT